MVTGVTPLVSLALVFTNMSVIATFRLLHHNNRMFALFTLMLSLRLMSFVAHILPLPGISTSQPILKTFENGSDEQVIEFKSMCPLQNVNGHYLSPWRETPQHAQGCSVPYDGPQGHSQHPEEVHIIHLLEVDKLIETFKHVNGKTMPVLTVWLEAASWQSKMMSLWSSVPFKDPSKFYKNDSDFVKVDDSGIASKREILPVFFNLEDVHPSKYGASSVNHYKMDSVSSQSHQSSPKASRPLILILTSDRPLTWLIKPGASWIPNLASKIQVMVEKDSSVDPFLPLEIIQKMWVKKVNRKTIQRFARRTFHGVASFTQIKGANSARINVGAGGIVDHERSHQILWRNRNKLNFCDFSSREDSYSVSATWSEDLPVDRCILGKGDGMKILIIEVQSLFKNEKSRNDINPIILTENHSHSQSSLSQVIILLSEVSTNEPKYGGVKNVTIFLKSEMNVQWLLSSSVKKSFLHFVTKDSDTIDCIKNCGKNFKFTSLQMPSSRNDFVKKVSKDFGSYIEFLTIKHITGFGLQVDQPQVELFSISPEAAASSTTAATISSFSDAKHDGSGEIRTIGSILESEIVITCEKSTLAVVLPAYELIRHGVRALHLRDKACQSFLNGTHFILTSLLGSCGSSVHNDRIISNRIFIDFSNTHENSTNFEGFYDIHDENKNEEGIPITCGLKPLLEGNAGRSIFNIRGDLISEEDKNVENPFPESSSSIYQLDLFYKSIQADKLSAVKYNEKINLHDQIFVQVWMDDAPSARAVPESCWISGLPPSNKNMSLLNGMCPVRGRVKLESQVALPSPSKPHSFVFSFEISYDVLHIGHEIFVHCQIGICISNSKLSKDKSLLCMDPQEHCQHLKLHPSRSHSISTAHQLLSRGPLVVSTAELSFKLNTPVQTKCPDVTVFPHSSAISTDMTAIIALCSFIIGMGLTATLWLIHNKTEPKHRGCQRDHSHGSQSAVLGSSLSPHSACSSTNSQCAITS